MWEYAALLEGWNKAHDPKGSEPAPPPPSEDDFERLRQIGQT